MHAYLVYIVASLITPVKSFASVAPVAICSISKVKLGSVCLGDLSHGLCVLPRLLATWSAALRKMGMGEGLGQRTGRVLQCFTLLARAP